MERSGGWGVGGGGGAAGGGAGGAGGPHPLGPLGGGVEYRMWNSQKGIKSGL